MHFNYQFVGKVKNIQTAQKTDLELTFNINQEFVSKLSYTIIALNFIYPIF